MMREFLEGIRPVKKKRTLPVKIANSILILLLGVALGTFAKWLDELSIEDGNWWQQIIGKLNLSVVFSELAVWILIAVVISIYSSTPGRASLNVFLFFVGMCCSYHLYTILFSGFNPSEYMTIWYAITLISPLLAFVCWYGKGKTKISLCIDILILTVMLINCFAIGLWYFDIGDGINTLIFVIAGIILYSTPKNTVISLAGALILSFLFSLMM